MKSQLELCLRCWFETLTVPRNAQHTFVSYTLVRVHCLFVCALNIPMSIEHGPSDKQHYSLWSRTDCLSMTLPFSRAVRVDRANVMFQKECSHSYAATGKFVINNCDQHFLNCKHIDYQPGDSDLFFDNPYSFTIVLMAKSCYKVLQLYGSIVKPRAIQC